VVSVQEDVLRGLKPKEMLALVFNSNAPGDIDKAIQTFLHQEKPDIEFKEQALAPLAQHSSPLDAGPGP